MEENISLWNPCLKLSIKSNLESIISSGVRVLLQMAGQIYVGAGYRSMSQEVKDLTEMVEIKIEMDLLEKRRIGQSEYMEINPDDYIIWKTIKWKKN